MHPLTLDLNNYSIWFCNFERDYVSTLENKSCAPDISGIDLKFNRLSPRLCQKISGVNISSFPDWPQTGKKMPYSTSKTGTLAKSHLCKFYSFKVQGPRLFNSLPGYLRDLTGCGKKKFKTELDKYLFRIPDEPLMPGYTIMRRSETNSIINMKEYIGPDRMDV